MVKLLTQCTYFLYADTYTVCTCRLHYTFNHIFFGLNYLLPAAACHLGVRKGQDCKVEDTDGGYVFDLNPLARHTWNNKDFYSVVNQSQYTYQLKVGLCFKGL